MWTTWKRDRDEYDVIRRLITAADSIPREENGLFVVNVQRWSASSKIGKGSRPEALETHSNDRPVKYKAISVQPATRGSWSPAVTAA